MKKLPVLAQIYLVTICLGGLACLEQAGFWLYREINHSPSEFLLFIVLAIFAGGRKITIANKLIDAEACSITLGFAITLTALLNVGPGTAMYVCIISCVVSCFFPKRQPAYQIAFNTALASIEAGMGGMAYGALKPAAIPGHYPAFFGAAIAAAGVYYFVNTFGVSIIVGTCSKSSPLKVWKDDFIWAAPGYFATASVSALATVCFQSPFAGLLVFVLPVIYLVYQMTKSFQTRAQDNDKHREEMQESQAHLAELYLATIKSLALSIDAKDQYTHQHILRVQKYAVAIAVHMGLTGAELEAVNTGALLHDIGKLGVPEYVLMKPGRLSAEEFDKIKKHPEIGEAILLPVEFPWPILPVVRSHHEKWDGTGYPDGLAGEDIPRTARIMAVADVYDALTSTRSYRTAWTHERAAGVIKKDAGTHFDPVVVEAFLQVIDGVVEEMALIGEGPLAPKSIKAPENPTVTQRVAQDISNTSTELYALYEVTRTLNSSIGSKDTVDYLCRKLEQLYPGSLFALLLKDGTEKILRVESARGLNELYFKGAKPVNVAGSPTVECLNNGKTYSGQFDSDDLLPTSVESSEWVPLQTAIIIPLAFEGHSFGTLNCYHPELFGFSAHDQSLFEMIATQASEALYNSLLFDRIRGEEMRDPLTQAFNLRHLTTCVDELCRSGQDNGAEEPFALLCVDIDHFRAINEAFGHHNGDLLLKGLASVLENAVRPDDKVARYGSDEFLILLDHCGPETVEEAEAKINATVASFETNLSHISLGTISLSVTIGSAVYPANGKDFASIVAAADGSLRQRKGVKKLTSLAQLPGVPDQRKVA